MKELSRGIKINILGNFLRFSRAGFFALAAWIYGMEAFGVYTVAWATLEILIRFGYFGLDQGLLFELSHLRSQGNETKLYQKIAASLKTCLGLGLFEAVGLVLYCHFFVDTALIRHSLYLLAPFLPIYLSGTLLLQATMGLKEMKYFTLVRSGVEPASLMLFAVLFLPLKTYGLILAQAASLLITALFSVLAFRRFFFWRPLGQALFQKIHFKSLVAYSFPMYCVDLFDTLFYRIDIYFLTAFLGTGSPEQKKLLGIYGLAKQIARVITQTKNAFGPIFAPVVSESFLGRNGAILLKQVQYALKKILLLNIPFLLFLVFFGMDILQWIGKEVRMMPAASYFWLLAGQFCYSNAFLLMLLLVTTRQAKRFLFAGGLVLGLGLLGGVILVPVCATVGAGFITFFCYLGLSLAALYEVWFRLVPNLLLYQSPASESLKYPQ